MRDMATPCAYTDAHREPVGVVCGIGPLRGRSMVSRGSDHAASGAAATRDRVPDHDRDDRADDRRHDRADVERAVDRIDTEERAGKEAADQGAHDAEHDVPDDAHALVPADKEAGDVTGDGAEHEPRNDAHPADLHPFVMVHQGPQSEWEAARAQPTTPLAVGVASP